MTTQNPICRHAANKIRKYSGRLLEVAVHMGFNALDTMGYVITAARIADIAELHVVKRDAVPNPNWLRPV